MNRLKELIDKLCPTGVKFIQLSDVVTVKRGVRVVKKQLSPVGKYPVFQNCLTPMGYYDQFNVSANTAFIICAGAAGEIGYSAIEFWAADDCFYFVCSNDIDSRYLYHFLLTQKTYLYSKIRKASIPRLSHKFIEIIKIPVPPLEVQREIVQILDNFTSLTAELQTKLQAELQARKKQYEYYRDKLLNFETNIHKEKLKSVAKISRGVRVTKSQLTDNGYPVYQNALTPMGYHSEYNVSGGTTYVISAGAAGEIGFSDENFWAADDCLVFTELNGVTNKYIYHFLMTKKNYIKTRVRKASIPRLPREVIENLLIPTPSIEIQNKIVDILDNFEKICSDLNIGLPAEIEARQKQYEYYRDALLSFDNSYFVNVERERERERARDEWRSGLIKLWQYVFGYAPVKLKDIAISIKDGMHNLPKSLFDNGDYPILSAQNIHNGFIDFSTKRYVDINTFLKERRRTNIESGDVLLTIVATIGRTAIIKDNTDFLLQRSVCVIKPKRCVLPSYLKYYLDTSKTQAYMQSNAHGSAQAGLYLNQVAEIEIMLPTLKEQERIVSILDRFDSLCNDISSGLPAEIEARQKQYEYYRDKLLSF